MTIKMRHSSGGRQIAVTPDLVDVYESAGWVRLPSTPAKKASAARKAAAATPSSSDTTTP